MCAASLSSERRLILPQANTKEEDLTFSSRAFKVLLTTLLFALLSSCGSLLRSDVVTFHEGPLPAGETIRIVAAEPGPPTGMFVTSGFSVQPWPN